MLKEKKNESHQKYKRFHNRSNDDKRSTLRWLHLIGSLKQENITTNTIEYKIRKVDPGIIIIITLIITIS